jgi:group I intron endonuclease
MRTCGIYLITNKVNGKVYIGSSRHVEGRWSSHRCELRRREHLNPHLQNAWDAYGEDAFVFSIVEECNSDRLTEREQFYMDKFNCLDREKGYNIRPKADNSTLSEETKRKIGDANRGKPSWIRGKHHSDATRQKISASNSSSGNHMAGKTGELHPFFGKKHTEKAKTLMSEAKLGKLNNASSKPVMQLTRTGTLVAVFPSASEAERRTGTDAKLIAACAKGKRKTTNGFRWEYEAVSEDSRTTRPLR